MLFVLLNILIGRRPRRVIYRLTMLGRLAINYVVLRYLYEDSRSIGVNRLRATMVYNAQLAAASPPLPPGEQCGVVGWRPYACVPP